MRANCRQSAVLAPPRSHPKKQRDTIDVVGSGVVGSLSRSDLARTSPSDPLSLKTAPSRRRESAATADHRTTDNLRMGAAKIDLISVDRELQRQSPAGSS